MILISESGAYDPDTGVLSHDAAVKIYEIEPGLDEVTAPLVGVDPGPSFHFVLNNKTFSDNRIPPRGFTNAAYDDFGGAPVAYSYADGQYWDLTPYAIPAGAASAKVTLYYQSTSKEFIEFLRDENTTDSQGQDLYDLWNDNGKCPPEVMWTGTLALTSEPTQTVDAEFTCVPPSGTVPFATSMSVTLTNLYTGQIRRISGRIDATLANGTGYANWRAGYTNVAGGESFVSSWIQNIPALGSVIGDNVFSLTAADVTPAPYNLPPYPAAGDTDTASCTVTGMAP